MFRFSATIFLLLPLLVAGCQPRPVTPPAPSAPVAHDDLYRTRADESYADALYHFSMARLLGTDGDLAAAAESLERAVAADPGSAYLRVTLAEVYLHLEKEQKALRAVEDALLRDPESLQGHLLMANLLSSGDDLAGAIGHLEKAAALAPGREGISIQLALFYGRAGQMDKSIVTLKSILAESPENSYAQLLLARAYVRTDLASLAEQEYRKLLAFNPDSFLALTELGQLYADTGRTDRQEALLLDHLQKYPDDSRVRHHLVGIYVDRGRFDAAREQLAALVEQDPGDTTALRKLGLLHIEAQEWARAGAYFRRLLELDAGDSQARYYLGITYEESGQWQTALETFAGVGAESAVHADALIHRGYNLHKLERTAEAVALLEENRELLSSRAEIFDYLSYLYSALDRPSEALAVIDAGLRQFPDDNTLLFRKVVLLDRMEQKARAADVARDLLQINPDHVNALNYLAYAYAVRNENLEEALTMAEKALAARDEYFIRDTLAWVLYRLGRFEAALAQLQVAVSAEPDDPVVLEHLGDVLRALGRDDEAQAAYRKALPHSSADSDRLQDKIDALDGGTD